MRLSCQAAPAASIISRRSLFGVGCGLEGTGGQEPHPHCLTPTKSKRCVWSGSQPMHARPHAPIEGGVWLRCWLDDVPPFQLFWRSAAQARQREPCSPQPKKKRDEDRIHVDPPLNLFQSRGSTSGPSRPKQGTHAAVSSCCCRCPQSKRPLGPPPERRHPSSLGVVPPPALRSEGCRICAAKAGGERCEPCELDRWWVVQGACVWGAAGQAKAWSIDRSSRAQ
jgi:hypothetical protein